MQQSAQTTVDPYATQVARLIQNIDELTAAQAAHETRRQEAVAAAASARRDIDLAQDLLHTSLQRIADLDDDTCQTRAVLAAKMKTIELLKEQAAADKVRAEEIHREAAGVQGVLAQQGTLLVDMQRRLLQAGWTPERVVALEDEAVAALEEKRRAKQKKQEEEERAAAAQSPRRKARFALFG